MSELKLRCPHCERDILLRVDRSSNADEPRPSAPPFTLIGKTVGELRLNIRAYNVLTAERWQGAGLTAESPATAILDLRDPQTWVNFGPKSFADVIITLEVELNYSLDRIMRSSFWDTAPSLFRSFVRSEAFQHRKLDYLKEYSRSLPGPISPPPYSQVNV